MELLEGVREAESQTRYPTRNEVHRLALEGISSMAPQVCPSDLSDGEWAPLSPLIPAANPGGRPRSVQIRRTLSGTFYVLRVHCP